MSSLSNAQLPRWQHLALAGSGLLLAGLLWWSGTHAVADASGLLARFAPADGLASLWQLMQSADLWRHVAVSLRRIMVGLGAALLFGVPLGVLIGAVRAVEASTTTLFQFLRMISPLSLMPVAVMLLGIGDAPVYFLLGFAAVWPVMLNTAAGVRQLNPEWLLLAHSLSASRWELLRHVILPGIVSQILTGIRLAIGVLWVVLVPCEMLGVSAGLGYFILDTRDRLAYSELTAAILVIGFLGFMLDALARWLQQRWSPGS